MFNDVLKKLDTQTMLRNFQKGPGGTPTFGNGPSCGHRVSQNNNSGTVIGGAAAGVLEGIEGSTGLRGL